MRRYAGQVARNRGRDLMLTVGLFALAAVAGLFGPRLLGSLIDSVQHGTTSGHVDTIVGLIALFLILQTVLTRYAKLAAGKFGEGVLAELRENFVARVLELPLSVVERAGSGDLLSRSSRDVDQLSMAARFGVPTTLVAIVTIAADHRGAGAGESVGGAAAAGDRAADRGGVRAGTCSARRRATLPRARGTRT